MKWTATTQRTAAIWTAFMMAGTAAQAQQSDWSYEASIYLYMPETKTGQDTPTGNFEGTLSFSDALSNLDMAFMGAFGAKNGRWSVLADYNYTDLTFNSATPGPSFSNLETSAKTQFFSGYLGYQVYNDSSLQVDVAGGFRWFSTETKFSLSPGTSPGQSNSVDNSWTDAVIGVRARYAFSDKWSSTAFVDYGGFSSDSETWQVLLTADYTINDQWLIRGGYRYISFDHNLNGNDYSFSQSGPLIGATYRF